MKSPYYNLVSIDEDSYMRTPSGLFYFVEGIEYDKYLFNAEIFLPLDNTYEKGQKVIVQHFALDSEVNIKGKKIRYVKNEEIAAYWDRTELKSKNFILAKPVYRVKKALAYETTEKLENVFTVTYSPFDSVKKGDEIAIYQDTDYPLPFKETVCITESHIIKNLTTGECMNDYVEVEPIKEDGYKEQNSIYVASDYVDKNWAKLEDKEVYAPFNRSLELPNGNYMIKETEIALTR